MLTFDCAPAPIGADPDRARGAAGRAAGTSPALDAAPPTQRRVPGAD